MSGLVVSTWVAARRARLVARTVSAARQAQRARSTDDRLRARRALAETLAEARALLLEAEPVMATGNGDPPQSAAALPPRRLDEMLPALERGLGRGHREVFAALDPAGEAASLGQVHRGLLHDGRPVAVKIQYPEIRRAIEAELRLLGLLPGLGRAERWGFDLDGYQRFFENSLARELDYLAEAERQEGFRDQVAVPGLIVPQVMKPLCGPGVLVQAWEDGVPLAEAAGWPRSDRFELAHTLLTTTFASLFVAGQVHADPHPANLRFRRGAGHRPQVVLYDFGCLLELERPRRLALLKLVADLRDGAPPQPYACLTALGFDGSKLDPIADRLEPLCRLLAEPFTKPEARLARWSLRERMGQLLGELEWWFRAAAPPDLVLLLRAFHGLVHQLTALQVDLPWGPVLEYAVGTELYGQARRLPSLHRELADAARSRGGPRRLRLRITDRGEVVKAVSFPAGYALRLESLVPDDLRRQLAAAGTDLAALAADLRRRGLEHGTLADATMGERSFSLWLE